MAKASTKTKGKKNMDNTENTGGKLSLEQRLENARKLVAKYEQQINALRQINNVEVGDDVDFKFGRSEKARTLTGTVIAVADTDQGRMVAIQTGEGLDVETKKVRAADIITNRTADERGGDEAPAADNGDEDPLAAA